MIKKLFFITISLVFLVSCGGSCDTSDECLDEIDFKGPTSGPDYDAIQPTGGPNE
jgi:hypothetical protein